MIFRSQSITIINWAAWAPRTYTEQEWREWSLCPKPLTYQDEIKATTIPAGLKRRCNKLAKMVLEISNLALEDNVIDYAVFCSQHGDLDTAVKIIKDIAFETAVSPTQFVQSVHNAPAGMFSIIHKLHQNMISIAAGEKSFFMAFIEAIAWLKQHPKSTVLLTMCDDSVPEVYRSLQNIENSFPYAISFILSNATNNQPHFSLSMSSAKNKSNKVRNIPYALEFLAWWLQSPTSNLNQQTTDNLFTWQPNE